MEEKDQVVGYEEKIQDLIELNRGQLDQREKLIQILPEMVLSMDDGKPTAELSAILRSMTDEGCRRKLEQNIMVKGAMQ